MKVILSAKRAAESYEFEIVANEAMSYQEFKKMYSDLTEWMLSNTEKFGESLPNN